MKTKKNLKTDLLILVSGFLLLMTLGCGSVGDGNHSVGSGGTTGTTGGTTSGTGSTGKASAPVTFKIPVNLK